MNLFELSLAFGLGFLVGLFFFGNLLWSINHLGTSRYPALLYGSGLLFRMLLFFTIALWALPFGIAALLFGLAGFTVARIAFVTSTTLGQPEINNSTSDAQQRVRHG